MILRLMARQVVVPSASTTARAPQRCSLLLAQDVILLLLLLRLQDLSLLLARLLLLGQRLRLHLLRFQLVDGLDKHTLVLVSVTLGMAIEVVIEVLVDLLLLTVLAEQPAEHPLATHPQKLRRHARLAAASALASTGVAALPQSEEVLAHA